MNFMIKVFLLGILMAPMVFATGGSGRGDAPENCDNHRFFVGIWEHVDTSGANRRITRYTIDNGTLNKKTTYTVNGSHCTFVESGIIKSCETKEASFSGDRLNHTFNISQAIKIKVHDIRFSVGVSECQEVLNNYAYLSNFLPYEHMQTFLVMRSDHNEWPHLSVRDHTFSRKSLLSY